MSDYYVSWAEVESLLRSRNYCLDTEADIEYVVECLSKEIPAADVRPVVFCKDCKWYRESEVLSPNRFCFRLKGNDGEPVGYNFSDMDFCSYGERREGGTP